MWDKIKRWIYCETNCPWNKAQVLVAYSNRTHLMGCRYCGRKWKE